MPLEIVILTESFENVNPKAEGGASWTVILNWTNFSILPGLNISLPWPVYVPVGMLEVTFIDTFTVWPLAIPPLDGFQLIPAP